MFEVFVGNLSHVTSEKDLKRLLSRAGDVVEVRFPLNVQGNPRGHALISFCYRSHAAKAIEIFDGCKIACRSIVVKEPAKSQSAIFMSLLMLPAPPLPTPSAAWDLPKPLRPRPGPCRRILRKTCPSSRLLLSRFETKKVACGAALEAKGVVAIDELTERPIENAADKLSLKLASDAPIKACESSNCGAIPTKPL
ncbi:hypothetical protein BDK51DRAFT_48261 [Blyttiomyces helicus]|uniref:RRM domain-containing protein n=1 Tax=Blyttiomyces helicus TaxID=388810 RepID=A0A4P9VZK5_9FUNG|nr:hypothetical protein BDK51DRAFT_48261 [Blyttiomyces helicus]|eukprot:RKO83256.1 hypothetical protein BDK51DRAFT_48261 [Blyttiomyces helicus]